MCKKCLSLLAVTAGLLSFSNRALGVAPFYEGKTMLIIVGATGGGFDKISQPRSLERGDIDRILK